MNYYYLYFLNLYFPKAEDEEEVSFGSIVYAKFGKNPWWPARIDAVELNRSGKSEPDK